MGWQRERQAYHGGCGRSSNALVYLPRRLDQRRPGQGEGCLVLLQTVGLLMLTSLLRLPGPLLAIDTGGGHHESSGSLGVRVGQRV